MKVRAFMGLGLTLLVWADKPSPPPAAQTPNSARYARQLLPAVVSIIDKIALLTASEKKRPEYAAVATGKDEYIYHVSDRVFIRRVIDRYELPTWRICGDFAVVRVELMDDSMKTLPPIMAWHMVYRNDQWERLIRDDQGRYLRENYRQADMPPYAIRCFDSTPAGPNR